MTDIPDNDAIRRTSSPSAIKRAILASTIGNGLEWFDFLAYGFFTVFISKAFFPASDPLVSMLVATATFAIPYLVRPFGGVLLSVYSDRIGRKPILSFMIVIMGFSTAAIGVTPSYGAIGIAAPLIVIAARILQGLSVGGEFASATAMLTEFAPPRNKVFFGSFQMCSQAFALALAGFAGFALATSLAPEALESWGWRVPFILGSLGAPVGFYIRRFVDESPEYTRDEAAFGAVNASLREVASGHLGSIVRGFGAIMAGTVSNYVWFIFLPLYVVKYQKLPMTSMFLSSMLSGTVLFLLVPFMGAFADRVGAKRLFTIGAVAFALLAFPTLSYLVVAPSFERLLLAQLLCTLPVSAMWAPAPALVAGMFPTGVRTTGMSISYNLAVLIFGGLAPLTLTWLIATTGSDMMPAYYILSCTLLALIALWMPSATKR